VQDPEYRTAYDLLTGFSPAPLYLGSRPSGDDGALRRGEKSPWHSHFWPEESGRRWEDGDDDEDDGDMLAAADHADHVGDGAGIHPAGSRVEDDDAWEWDELEDGRAPGEAPLARHTGRRLLDSFGDSLRHVNMLLDEEFGVESRSVPAHMPHFVNRRIITELQAKWEAQFNATSSHRFRQSNDMQYAFTYFYYLMSRPVNFSLPDYFASVDRDASGALDLNEMRTIATQLRHPEHQGKALSTVAARLTVQLAQNGTFHRTLPANLSDAALEAAASTVRVTFADVAANSSLVKDIRDREKRRKLHRHELKGLEEVSFLQVRDDEDGVLKHLDSIRRRRPKFICLNDNMNATSPNPRVVKALHDVYGWLFPNRSSFELPDNETNRFATVQDWREFLADEAQEREASSAARWARLVGHAGSLPGPVVAGAAVALLFAIGLVCCATRRGNSTKRNAWRVKDDHTL
jgi:hypothetical protein